jgi:hypothetical protein
VDAEPALIRQIERHLRYRLEEAVAAQAWGDEGAFLEMRDRDTQLRLALEILSRSRTPEDVFRAANDRRISGLTPVAPTSAAGPDR